MFLFRHYTELLETLYLWYYSVKKDTYSNQTPAPPNQPSEGFSECCCDVLKHVVLHEAIEEIILVTCLAFSPVLDWFKVYKKVDLDQV